MGYTTDLHLAEQIMTGDYVVNISEGLYTLKRLYFFPHSHFNIISVIEFCVALKFFENI